MIEVPVGLLQLAAKFDENEEGSPWTDALHRQIQQTTGEANRADSERRAARHVGVGRTGQLLDVLPQDIATITADQQWETLTRSWGMPRTMAFQRRLTGAGIAFKRLRTPQDIRTAYAILVDRFLIFQDIDKRVQRLYDQHSGTHPSFDKDMWWQNLLEDTNDTRSSLAQALMDFELSGWYLQETAVSAWGERAASDGMLLLTQFFHFNTQTGPSDIWLPEGIARFRNRLIQHLQHPTSAAAWHDGLRAIGGQQHLDKLWALSLSPQGKTIEPEFLRILRRGQSNLPLFFFTADDRVRTQTTHQIIIPRELIDWRSTPLPTRTAIIADAFTITSSGEVWPTGRLYLDTRQIEQLLSWEREQTQLDRIVELATPLSDEQAGTKLWREVTAVVQTSPKVHLSTSGALEQEVDVVLRKAAIDPVNLSRTDVEAALRAIARRTTTSITPLLEHASEVGVDTGSRPKEVEGLTGC